MSTVPRIVSRTRTRKVPEGGGYSVRRLNATHNEMARDILELQDIYNNTIRPLIAELPLGARDPDNTNDTPITSSLDAIANGLSGDQIWIDNTATSTSSSLFFDGRKLTIKESLLKLSAQMDAAIARLASTIDSNVPDVTVYTIDATTMNSAQFTTNDKIQANNTSAIWNANKLQGIDLPSGTPSSGQVLQYSTSTGDWELGTIAYTADGQGIEVSANQFSLELADSTLTKSASGLAGNYTTDGNGISLSGNSFSIVLDGDTLKKSGSGIKLGRSSQWIPSGVFLAHDQGTPGPSSTKVIKGSGDAAVAAAGLNYDYTDDEYASCIIGVPVDDNEVRPSQVRFTIHCMAAATAGAGTDAVFTTAIGDSGAVVENGEAFVVTWSQVDKHTFTVSTTNMSVGTGSSTHLEALSSTIGTLNLRISRLAGTDIGDDFQEDVTFFGVTVEWIW